MKIPFKDMLDKKVFVIIIRTLVGGFFLLAGAIKLSLPVEEVQALIRTFDILPTYFTYWLALILPWIELIPGILLIIGIRPIYSVGFIIGLTVILNIGLISVIIRGIPVEDCGCLGGWIKEPPPVAFGRNIGIILLSLLILRFYLKNSRN